MQNKNMLASILVCFIGFVSMAQGAEPPPPGPPFPPGVPIDGGAVALFIVAIAYGAYKTYKLSTKRAS